MRKVLIVGLGGSGGKTLSFIMDELKVILKDNGWNKDSLPECWQFVHIDVPSSADGTGKGLAASVEAQGGKYLGLANVAPYPPYDQVVFDNLNDSPEGLRTFARWRPNASHLGGLTVTGGAGQFRAVGRVVTLSNAGGIYAALDNVVSSLRNKKAGDDLEEMSKCFDADAETNEPPLVLLVSSMAGGSGASMVMDVADILRGIQPDKFSGNETAAFLYTADVFKSIPKVYKGAGSGTLATLSELTNALSAWDTPLTEGYWKSIVPSAALQNSFTLGRGPKLIFPIGSETRGIPFGTSPEDVYRGFSKMLSPLFYSDNLQVEFHAYVQTNWPKVVTELLGSNQRDKQNLITKRLMKDGTKVKDTVIRPMVFPTWGSSSISMGRNRYKEYAAQRIGREMAAILQEGFRRPGANEVGLEEAIATTAESVYPTFIDLLDLGGDGNADWKKTGKLASSVLKTMGENRSLISKATSSFVENFSGTRAAIVTRLRGRLVGESPERERLLSDISTMEVQNWLSSMTQRLDNAVLYSLSRGGFETTKKVLDMLRSDLHLSQNALIQNASVSVTASKDALAALLQRHANSNEAEKTGSAFSNSVSESFNKFLRDKVTEKTSVLLADVLGEVYNKLIPEIIKALEKSRASLSSQLNSSEEAATSAAYRDAPITTWPKSKEVPAHFKPTVNEVVITGDDEYDAAFNAHVGAESGQSGSEGVRNIAELILFRKFLLQGGSTQAKVGLSSEPGAWHPSLESNSSNWMLPKLNNGATSNPKYSFKFTSDDLRALAFEYVSITGSSFELYTRKSISEWIQSDPEHEEVFRAKLGLAISYASPLVGIDSKAVSIFHGNNYEAINYSFSDVPISESSKAIKAICTSWGTGSTAVENIKSLVKRCDPASSAKEIFIRSETPPYLPWVFSSLTKPVRDNMMGHGSSASPVWTNMRARQLREFIPLGSDLVDSFLRGWFLGRITGLIQIETSTEDRPFGVSVFPSNPNKQSASAFGSGTLGAQRLGLEGKGDDSSGLNIPVILLETLPLALANASADINSLQPYLDLIELGFDIKKVGGVEAHKMTGLDLWFMGQQKWPESQLSFKNEDGSIVPTTDMNARRKWAHEWLDRNIEYLEGIDSKRITEGNFWALNPEYELARELIAAAKMVQQELESPNLGQVQVGMEGNRFVPPEDEDGTTVQRPEH